MALQIPLHSVNRKLKKKKRKVQNTGVGWGASAVRADHHAHPTLTLDPNASSTERILRHTVVGQPIVQASNLRRSTG
jgi:hypothetical protein